MKAKHAAVPLVIAILLSTLGYAIASWTDQVVIEGTADMGTLTLAFGAKSGEGPSCTEWHWRPEYGEVLMPGEYKEKNVGSASAEYSEEIIDHKTGTMGWKVLTITVEKAYPCYYIFTKYSVRNIGTIPLELYDFVITGEKLTSDTGELVYVLLYEPIDMTIGYLWEDVNKNGIIDPDVDKKVIWIEMTNDWPVQIDPDNDNRRELDLHFLQEAQECHVYEIHVELLAVQWNKLYETQGP
jgi:hypothetical protein